MYLQYLEILFVLACSIKYLVLIILLNVDTIIFRKFHHIFDFKVLIV